MSLTSYRIALSRPAIIAPKGPNPCKFSPRMTKIFSEKFFRDRPAVLSCFPPPRLPDKMTIPPAPQNLGFLRIAALFSGAAFALSGAACAPKVIGVEVEISLQEWGGIRAQELRERIAAGWNPNRAGDFGQTPLMLAAAYNSSPEISRELIRLGANPRAKAGGIPVLAVAAKSNPNPAVLRVLLDAGIRPDSPSHSGATPLMFAAAHNPNPAVVAELLRGGANPNARDGGGWTPLHWAAWQNARPQAAAALLRAAARPDARDHNGITP